jgi:uncharacterized protein (DUF4415 family)
VIDREHELAALAAQPDAAIDTSDLPASDGWDQAERGRFWRPVKRSVTIRLDADVIDWFRRREPKYPTAINRALREHMKGKGGPGMAGG